MLPGICGGVPPLPFGGVMPLSPLGISGGVVPSLLPFGIWPPIPPFGALTTHIAGAAAEAAHTRSAADNAGAGLARGFCTVYIDCIRFALGDVRRAEHDIRKVLRSHGGNERVAVRALHFYGVTRAAGAADADRVLFGIRCGGLQHAGAACAKLPAPLMVNTPSQSNVPSPSPVGPLTRVYRR